MEGNPPPAMLPSCLDWAFQFSSMHWTHSLTGRALFSVSYETCPSQCQALLHSRPPNLPWLDETLPKYSGSLYEWDHQIHPPGKAVISHLIYNDSLFCSQRACVSRNKVFICQMPMLGALVHDSHSDTASSIFCSTPASAAVGLSSRKRMEYLQHHPLLFSRSTNLLDLATLNKDESKVSFSRSAEEFTVQMNWFQGAKEGGFQGLICYFSVFRCLEKKM